MLNNKKHGLTHTPEYSVWTNMKTRCHNKNRKEYKNYGGRGIVICDRWLEFNGFQNFFDDMGERPSKKHTIERSDNSLGYFPENCVWATILQQANNRRNNKKILFKDRLITPKELSKIIGVNYGTILARISAGWTDKKLTLPNERNGTVTYNGIIDTYKGWSERTGIKQSTIAMRILKYKWTTEKSLKTGAKNENF